jgi:hypothetical protein
MRSRGFVLAAIVVMAGALVSGTVSDVAAQQFTNPSGSSSRTPQVAPRTSWPG